MYFDFFGMKHAPFELTPDIDCLFLSKQHTKAMVYMDYATWNAGGFVVITGEIGSGKTTLVKWLLSKSKNKNQCFHVEFTNLTGNDFFIYLLKQVGVSYKEQDKISLVYALHEYLKKSSRNGRPCLLVIDEAQNLTADQLEDIRMLAALEGTDGPLLRIILLGQPELINTIQSTEQFKQRVKLHYHLKGLSIEDLEKYIEFRMEKSGYEGEKLFNGPLISEIFRHSNGIPRLINKICDGLLICAYADDRYILDPKDLESILVDLMIATESNKPQPQNVVKTGAIRYGVLLERLAVAIENLNENIALIAGKK